MANDLKDRYGRKTRVMARVDGEPRKVMKLRLLRAGRDGLISIGREFDNKYVLVMVLEPDSNADQRFIKAFSYAGSDRDAILSQLTEGATDSDADAA